MYCTRCQTISYDGRFLYSLSTNSESFDSYTLESVLVYSLITHSLMDTSIHHNGLIKRVMSVI